MELYETQGSMNMREVLGVEEYESFSVMGFDDIYHIDNHGRVMNAKNTGKEVGIAVLESAICFGVIKAHKITIEQYDLLRSMRTIFGDGYIFMMRNGDILFSPYAPTRSGYTWIPSDKSIKVRKDSPLAELVEKDDKKPLHIVPTIVNREKWGDIGVRGKR